MFVLETAQKYILALRHVGVCWQVLGFMQFQEVTAGTTESSGRRNEGSTDGNISHGFRVIDPVCDRRCNQCALLVAETGAAASGVRYRHVFRCCLRRVLRILAQT